MAKTETEIVEAHRTTLEAFTGKKAIIKLISKEEEILKIKTLSEIENAVQRFNSYSSIKEKNKCDELVTLRRIFCLLASFGHNNRQIQNHLSVSYDQVRHNLRQCKNHLQIDPDFIALYEKVKTILLSGY